MRGILSFFICLFLGMSVASAKLSVPEEEVYRLMIYGDSLSAGHQLPRQDSFYIQLQLALWQKEYAQVRIIHQSRSGETTEGGLQRLSEALALKPNGVLLELGINDVFQQKSTSSVYQNLSQIIQAFQQNGVSVLLIGMQAPPVFGSQFQQDFAALYQRLADENGLILYPFFMKDLFEMKDGTVKPVAGLLKKDRVHPTKEGVELMVANILPYVETFLRQNGVYPKR